jgi:hypothetical protein
LLQIPLRRASSQKSYIKSQSPIWQRKAEMDIDDICKTILCVIPKAV